MKLWVFLNVLLQFSEINLCLLLTAYCLLLTVNEL
jgi:hypothetical protein